MQLWQLSKIEVGRIEFVDKLSNVLLKVGVDLNGDDHEEVFYTEKELLLTKVFDCHTQLSDPLMKLLIYQTSWRKRAHILTRKRMKELKLSIRVTTVNNWRVLLS